MVSNTDGDFPFPISMQTDELRLNVDEVDHPPRDHVPSPIIFQESIELHRGPRSASPRSYLKPQIDEMLQCLERLKSEEMTEKASTMLDSFVNEMRLDLAASTSGWKRNIDECRTVNINVEERMDQTARIYASKNC